MDVHPTKNGIQLGIDPYPYKFSGFFPQAFGWAKHNDFMGSKDPPT